MCVLRVRDISSTYKSINQMVHLKVQDMETDVTSSEMMLYLFPGRAWRAGRGGTCWTQRRTSEFSVFKHFSHHFVLA